jgi:hypothetical protein
MVERIYKRTFIDEEQVITEDGDIIESPKAKACSECNGKLDKGVEVVVENTVKGYIGTYCSYRCSTEARLKRNGFERFDEGRGDDIPREKKYRSTNKRLDIQLGCRKIQKK